MKPAAPASAARIVTEIVPYAGWARNLRVSNGDAELVITLDVGPRVIRYALAGGRNVFGELSADLGGAGEPGFKLRGGHRFWVAPEDPRRTYQADNVPVEHAVDNGVVSVSTPPDAEFGLEKRLQIALAPSGSQVVVTHRVRNLGDRPADLAPWALSVMAKGGTAILPLPGGHAHPTDLTSATAADFAPGCVLALWPYFRFGDARYQFGARHVRIRQDSGLPSTKIGLRQSHGWAAYLVDGLCFAKRFPYDANAHYTDGGVNFECYTDPDMLELESLGPFTTLGPGAEVAHVEVWSLNTLPADVTQAPPGNTASDDDLDRLVVRSLPSFFP